MNYSYGAAASGGQDAKVETVQRKQPKVGRNDPCPCGSGKKYKKCHGADGGPPPPAAARATRGRRGPDGSHTPAKTLATADDIPLALTFDDVLLLPGHSEVHPREVDLRTSLTARSA